MNFLMSIIRTSYLNQQVKFNRIPAFFLVLIVLFCFSGCKSSSYLRENICSEGISARENNQKSGPITVQIKIDSVQVGDQVDRIDSSFTLRINKQSKLIAFNNEVAIKFFHIESKEYGNSIHELKYHVFIKHNGCWRIWTRNSRSINSNSKLGNMTFSGTLSIPEKVVFIKVVWYLHMIN